MTFEQVDRRHNRNRTTMRLAAALMLGTAASAIVITPAHAQTTTGSIRGQVTSSDGVAVGGATVTARDLANNRTVTATSATDGGYAFNGLRPASYEIIVTGTDGASVTQRVTLAIGQAATLNLTVGAVDGAEVGADVGVEEVGGDVVVTAFSTRETRTSEVATNVSQQQIRSLPQTDRNFLSFAALAPGVRYIDSETSKGIQAGASTQSQVNVFVDGVSLKNRLREGGIAGQQNSRGNPFGQLAVQEFRVLTQNYKAEYEEAGSAIITAVTKSGGNQFRGEVFGQYTDRSLIEESFFDIRDGNPKPDFRRVQYGASLGGPIIKDRLFFFRGL